MHWHGINTSKFLKNNHIQQALRENNSNKMTTPTRKVKRSSRQSTNSPAWSLCKQCDSFLLTRDCDSHTGDVCKAIFNDEHSEWKHAFVRHDIIHSFLECLTNDQGSTPKDYDDYVYISQSLLQVSGLKIGDTVLLQPENHPPQVKRVWLTTEKSLSSITITQTASKVWPNIPTNGDTRVTLSNVNETDISRALSIDVVCVNWPEHLASVQSKVYERLKMNYCGRVLSAKSSMFVYFYGLRLFFNVENIAGDVNLDGQFRGIRLDDGVDVSACKQTPPMLYKIDESTHFHVKNTNPRDTTEPIKLGGVDNILNEARKLIANYFNATNPSESIKSIVFTGFAGVGKTAIIKQLAREQNKPTTYIDQFYFYERMNTAAEMIDELERIRSEIVTNPSVLVLDDLDVICPSRDAKITEHEKRLAAILIAFIDSLRAVNARVFILAACARIDAIERQLRRFNRVEFEIDVAIPDVIARGDILRSVLNGCVDVTEEEMNELIGLTPGFVGADIQMLIATARSFGPLSLANIKGALPRIKPEAMREIRVENPNLKWDDIGGYDDVKFQFTQIFEWPMKYPEKFRHFGIPSIRGVLMFGPPGCSKTMFAKALATEGKYNFFSIKGPELFNKYVGESERAVRDLFRKARQAAPSIVFFDEIDAIGTTRGLGSDGGNVQDRVVAQLLTEMDGIHALNNVFVVAATNRPGRIDPALMRPGRLEKLIYVQLPDGESRRKIFQLRLDKMPIRTGDVARMLDDLVVLTEGYSGAEIQSLCTQSALASLKSNINADWVDRQDFFTTIRNVRPRTDESMNDHWDAFAIEHGLMTESLF